jgi:hypothetical protein
MFVPTMLLSEIKASAERSPRQISQEMRGACPGRALPVQSVATHFRGLPLHIHRNLGSLPALHPTPTQISSFPSSCSHHPSLGPKPGPFSLLHSLKTPNHPTAKIQSSQNLILQSYSYSSSAPWAFNAMPCGTYFLLVVPTRLAFVWSLHPTSTLHVALITTAQLFTITSPARTTQPQVHLSSMVCVGCPNTRVHFQ